jgi:hypothetical protein
VSIDFAAIGAALGFKARCVLNIHLPERCSIERPALDDHALTVTLSETYGPFSDSPRRPLMTITHRATGLALTSVAESYPADKKGLRQAVRVCKALRKAPGFDWKQAEPRLPDVPLDIATATLRQLTREVLS